MCVCVCVCVCVWQISSSLLTDTVLNLYIHKLLILSRKFKLVNFLSYNKAVYIKNRSQCQDELSKSSVRILPTKFEKIYSWKMCYFWLF